MKHREEIIIQGPAVQQLQHHRGCIERTCLGSIGCLGVFFILAMLVLGFITRERQTQVDQLPSELYSEIYMYNEDIDRITVVKGTDQHPILETVAYAPKIALYPIIHFTEKNPYADLRFWEGYKAFLTRPLINEHDSYSLIWYTISASPAFLLDLHEHELVQRGFEVTNRTKTSLTFSNGILGGEVVITRDAFPYTMTITLSPLNT